MRNVRKKLRDGSQGNFVVSDRSGPAIIKTIIGTDNLLTAQPTEFPYLAVKPYTSILTPSVDPLVGFVQLGPDAVLLTAPSPELILSQIEEDLWYDRIFPLASDISINASNNAIERCLAYGDLLMYVTAAEARTTLAMVHTVFVRLFRAVFDVYKQAKKLNLPATIDVLSDLWLEYRYGWRPFMGDIENLHKTLTTWRHDGVKSSFGQSKFETDQADPIHIGSVVVPFEDCDFTYKVSITPSLVAARAGFNYLNKSSSRNDDWLAKLGLDVESLLSTGWDLIPFSFIVDMFFNVGSILQTQNSSEQVDSFNHYRTIYSEGTLSLDCVKVEQRKASVPFDLLDYLSSSKIKLSYDGRRRISTLDPYDFKAFVDFLVQGGLSMTLNDASNRLYGHPKLLDHYLYPKPGFLYGTTVTEANRPWQVIPLYPFTPLDREFWSDAWKIQRLDSRGEKPLRPYRYVGTGPMLDFLYSLDASDMSEDEYCTFMLGMIDPVPSYYKQQLIYARTSAVNSSANDYIKSTQHRYAYSTHGLPDGILPGSYESPPWYHRTYCSSYMVGYQSPKPPTAENVWKLSYELPYKVHSRRPTEKFFTEFTVDVELNTAQYADLGALAWSLTKRFR